MKKSPVMLIATFGLFLGLQAYSTCLCGVAVHDQEPSCCHSKPVVAQGPDIKGPCCDRCAFRSPDSIVIRDSAVSDSIPFPFLQAHTISVMPTDIPVDRVFQSAFHLSWSIALSTCQPRAPPVG